MSKDIPAFPCGTDVTQGQFQTATGMNLMDYFAAAALTGLLSNRLNTDYKVHDYAYQSYAIASSMLKQRSL